MWRLFLLSWIFQISRCTCPSGLDLVRNGQCTGLYKTVNLNFAQATDMTIDQCKEIQAQPVIIHNYEDQAYWVDRVDHTSSRTFTALGLMCNTNSKKWEWADGSELNYKPEKYNSSLDQSCVTGYAWYMIPNEYGMWYLDTSTDPYLFNVFCMMQLPLPPVRSPDGCDNFDDDSEDGVCYQIGETAESWTDAQAICRSFGADLASIHNQQENSFVRRLAVSHGTVSGLYLGATISGKGNEFGWIDGSDWGYDNFFTGFPIAGFGDCVMMDTEGGTGQWVNIDCSTKQSVACIRQQNSSTSACPTGPWKEGQVIYSPGFPYDASIQCDYMLSVDVGKKIEVEILLLEANSCCDHLVILENYFGSTVIANLTGEVSQKTYTTSSSNFMRVSWLPNGGVNVRGMMMTFRAV